MAEIKKKCVAVLAGDFNTRIGKPCETNDASVIGTCGYLEKETAHESVDVQENLKLLKQHCLSHELVIANTRFEETHAKLVTFRKSSTKIGTPIERGGF